MMINHGNAEIGAGDFSNKPKEEKKVLNNSTESLYAKIVIHLSTGSLIISAEENHEKEK
jgi:hypothetical protein